MSQIDDLVKHFCLKGVPFKALGDVGDFTRGTGLQKADLREEGAPAIHYGQIHTYYGTWTDTTKSFIDPALATKLRRAKPGDLIVATTSEDDAAVAKATAWLGAGEVAVSGDAFIYRHTLDPRYVAYLFQATQFQAQKHRHITGAKVRRIAGDALAGIRIPVPPVEVQIEISRTLDAFTDAGDGLAVALSRESELRRAQHFLSREAILGRDEKVAIDGSVALRELVQLTNGKPHERLVSDDGTVALLTARFISTSGRLARWVKEPDALAPAHRGEIALVMSDLPNGRALARCFYVDEDDKYSVNQRVCLLRVHDSSVVSPRWLYHFLDRNPQLLSHDNRQDQTHLKKDQILDIRVPVTSFAEQEEAAATLDRLDQSMSELVVSIEAERVARRKQYEYYRDRLLTFKEVAA